MRCGRGCWGGSQYKERRGVGEGQSTDCGVVAPGWSSAPWLAGAGLLAGRCTQVQLQDTAAASLRQPGRWWTLLLHLCPPQPLVSLPCLASNAPAASPQAPRSVQQSAPKPRLVAALPPLFLPPSLALPPVFFHRQQRQQPASGSQRLGAAHSHPSRTGRGGTGAAVQLCVAAQVGSGAR